MASIHPLTDASALGYLLVVVLVDRLERRPLEQDRSLACVPGQCREIVDADVDGGVSSIVLFLLDLWNLIDEFQIDFPTMRDDACLLDVYKRQVLPERTDWKYGRILNASSTVSMTRSHDDVASARGMPSS